MANIYFLIFLFIYAKLHQKEQSTKDFIFFYLLIRFLQFHSTFYMIVQTVMIVTTVIKKTRTNWRRLSLLQKNKNGRTMIAIVLPFLYSKILIQLYSSSSASAACSSISFCWRSLGTSSQLANFVVNEARPPVRLLKEIEQLLSSFKGILACNFW